MYYASLRGPDPLKLIQDEQMTSCFLDLAQAIFCQKVGYVIATWNNANHSRLWNKQLSKNFRKSGLKSIKLFTRVYSLVVSTRYVHVSFEDVYVLT